MKKIDKTEEARLLKEVTTVFENSVILRKDAEFNHQLIKDFNKKYPNSKIKRMSWQEADSICKQADTIWARMTISVKELQKIDQQYEKLRREVNKFYGKAILPKSNTKLPSLANNKPADDGEEWKN